MGESTMKWATDRLEEVSFADSARIGLGTLLHILLIKALELGKPYNI